MKRLSSAATESGHVLITPITQELIGVKSLDAKRNPRKREIHVFHSGENDSLQRMLNALEPGSYIAPHRHTAVPKAECIVLLKGAIGFVGFEENGKPDPDQIYCLSDNLGVLGVDYRAGLWHTFFALEPHTVIFEVKAGPYDQLTDKEFAPWAPQENDPNAMPYLARLEDQLRSRFGLIRRAWKTD